MDADTQRAIAALKKEVELLQYKVGMLEILSGKHICWCGPGSNANKSKCMICGAHINPPGCENSCPEGYCTCSH